MVEYTQKTQALLDRMSTVALLKNVPFDKPRITDLVRQSYEIFDLPVPQIIWCADITDERFQGAAWAASAAWAARAAGAAWAARAASAASAARAASAASAARAARAAGAAWAASAAWAARAAGAAWAARAASAGWAASDYDGQEFIYIYEYLQTNKGNENDRKFCEAQELFLQLKEAGMGYWAEKDGVVYVCPNPTVMLDDDQRYHNDQGASIYWVGGLQLFYLDGVNLDADLYQQVMSQAMTFDEILQIPDADVRAVALKYNKNAIIASGAELIDEHPTAGELFLIEGKQINEILEETRLYFLRMKCPTGRVFVEAVEPKYAKQYPYALHCQARAFGVPVEVYEQLRREG